MKTPDAAITRKQLFVVACIVVSLCTLIGVISIAIAAPGLHLQQAQAEPLENGNGRCAHVWRDDKELIHVEPITHEVHHDAVYEDVMVEHTVCNVCEAVIDGQTREHADATGHTSYTTAVPRSERKLVQAAWTETVIDEEAHDELQVRGKTCTLCGETREKAA